MYRFGNLTCLRPEPLATLAGAYHDVTGERLDMMWHGLLDLWSRDLGQMLPAILHNHHLRTPSITALRTAITVLDLVRWGQFMYILASPVLRWTLCVFPAYSLTLGLQIIRYHRPRTCGFFNLQIFKARLETYLFTHYRLLLVACFFVFFLMIFVFPLKSTMYDCLSIQIPV